MQKTKRFLSVLLALMTLLFLFCPLFLVPVGATSAPEGLDEQSSVLIYHNESGKVLFQKGEAELIPAGPAPRMTAALLFLEHYGKDLEKTVTVNRRVTGLATSTMNPGLKGGEEISVYDLLCGMLIANSNDAVYALAFDMYDNAEGAPEMLLAAMNDKAASLGMTGTRYVNITGDDPPSTEMLAGYSSLSDLLLLALAFKEQKALADICAIDDITLEATNKSGSRRLLTRNYLLSAKRIGGYTYKYATGLAANEGSLSGYHAIATAKLGNKSFTCISVGARERYAAFTDASTLFDWADGAYAYKKVLDHTTILGEIAVRLSDDSDYVTVAPEKDLSAFLPKDIDIEKDIRVETDLAFTDLAAPVYEGLIVGSVTVYYGEEVLGSTRLVTKGSLAMSNSRYYLTMAKRFFETPLFLSMMAGLLLFCMVCVLVGARVQYLRKNRPADLSFVEEGDEEPTAAVGAEPGLGRKLKGLARGVAERVAEKMKGGQKDESAATKRTVKRGEGALEGRVFEEGAAEQREARSPAEQAQEEQPTHLPLHFAQEQSPEERAQGKNEGRANASKEPANGHQGPKPTVKPQLTSEQQKDGHSRRLTGAKRLPGRDPERQARKQQEMQGGYVPSGWGSRKDETEE